MAKFGGIKKLVDRKDKKKKPISKRGAGTFIVGSAVGAATGIALAPSSGKQTRAKFKRKAKTGTDKAKSTAKDVKATSKSKAKRVTKAAPTTRRSTTSRAKPKTAARSTHTRSRATK